MNQNRVTAGVYDDDGNRSYSTHWRNGFSDEGKYEVLSYVHCIGDPVVGTQETGGGHF